MKVVARHRYAPLVALDDGTVIDTDELEVMGTGDVSGPSWEQNPDIEMDPRWAEIAQADSSSLGVAETKVQRGSRAYRAPSEIREYLKTASVDTPLADGKGLSLDELDELSQRDEVDGPAEDWLFKTVNKHEDNPDADDEAKLFGLAEPELDWDEIDSALDDDSVVAAITPPVADAAKTVYLAIIEEEDQESVQDLVALVSTTAGAASAYRYKEGAWEEAPDVLTLLQSSAPPPIKQLEDWQTESIIEQMNSVDFQEDPSAEEGAAPSSEETPPEDSTEKPVQASAFDLPRAQMLFGPDNKTVLAILAAGGADRNRGNAETLRRYWTVGKGGAKIRWGTPGDWTRCRRQLSRYLGTRAAGYCQLRHKEMTGVYTGSRLNVGGNGR